jgi:TM2 domain-containing membrane protein YozV
MSDLKDNKITDEQFLTISKKINDYREKKSYEKKESMPETKFCNYCGERIASRAEICPKCGVRQDSTTKISYVGQLSSADTGAKNPLLAAILSLLIPGLGQIYNGEWVKGLIFFSISVGVAIVSILTGGILCCAGWVIPVFAAYDAYKIAQRINTGIVR